MGLFHFIEEQNAVRFAAHSLGQITALLVTHISGGGTDQAGDRVLFHELTHVHPDQVVLAVKQEASKGFAQLGFTHACRPQEEKRTCGSVRVGQS